MFPHYPKTLHLQGSGTKTDRLDAIDFQSLAGKNMVIEEKIDGMAVGIFCPRPGCYTIGHGGEIIEQDPLVGRLRAWLSGSGIDSVLEDRYVLYGEWMLAKHNIFYDRLPHYFIEYDLYDRERQCFLTTADRQALLGAKVSSVPVLWSGTIHTGMELTELITRSAYQSSQWLELLETAIRQNSQSLAQVLQQTDQSDLMEGAYCKIEEEGQVTGRYKWIRASFIECIMSSNSHWRARSIIENVCQAG
jgi:hypothetical protein